MVLFLLDRAPETVTALTWVHTLLTLLLGYEAGQPASAPLKAEAAVRGVLQQAPELASWPDITHTRPMHYAVSQERLAPVAELLLQLAPAAAGQAGWKGNLALHGAAGTTPDFLQQLLAAHPAAAMAQNEAGEVPLHQFAKDASPGMLSSLLAAAPAAAGVADNRSRLPLQAALRSRPGRTRKARLLLAATEPPAAVAALAAAGKAAAPLWPEFVSRQPLSAADWQEVPLPCPSLGAALQVVVACSEQEAGEVVRRLHQADRERLRAGALALNCLALPASAHRSILSCLFSRGAQLWRGTCTA
ncbi:hypothetical protein ABPG75_005974 [Micractinium tetrahymenae]